MLFENQYQIAYVTADFSRATDILCDQFGVAGFTGLAGDEVVENRVWTPEGEVDIGMRAAIAQVGDLTVEVLQPVSGATRIFTEMLTPEQPLRVHHIGMRCADLDAVRAEHERHGRSAVMMGGFKTARFMYIDARAVLGHYLEYASAPPEYWQR
jgi:glyoxalase/bleomycin resistance protein/dioxygenase superfamily protein